MTPSSIGSISSGPPRAGTGKNVQPSGGEAAFAKLMSADKAEAPATVAEDGNVLAEGHDEAAGEDLEEATAPTDIEAPTLLPPPGLDDQRYGLGGESPMSEVASETAAPEAKGVPAGQQLTAAVIPDDLGAAEGRTISPKGEIASVIGLAGAKATIGKPGAPMAEDDAKPDVTVQREIGEGVEKSRFTHFSQDTDRQIRILPTAERSVAPVRASLEEPASQPTHEQIAMKAEISIQMGVDAKGDATAAHLSAPRNPAHVAQSILRQIGDQAGNQQGDRIEVTLTPEELGKVRLVISGGERPAVAVYADNPETLDLLRRHADLLAKELRDTGLSGADLSFADNTGTGGRQAAADGRSPPEMISGRVAPQIEPAVAPTRPPPRVGSQIDIRI